MLTFILHNNLTN